MKSPGRGARRFKGYHHAERDEYNGRSPFVFEARLVVKIIFALLLWVTVPILLISGIVFISNATGFHVPSDARTPGMIGGIFCLILACSLLVFGIFMSRQRDGSAHPPLPPHDLTFDDRSESRHDGIRPI
jgi:hypothetical protein